LHIENAHLLLAFGKILPFSALSWLQSTEIKPNVLNWIFAVGAQKDP
jgi:hypothetical protein